MNRLRIVGVGQTGGNILDQIVLRGTDDLDLVYWDADRQTLEASVVVEKRLLGEEAVRGLGCHGDRELGQRVAQAAEGAVQEMVEGCHFLILALGLGGGTGSALARELATAAQKNQTQVVVVCTLPMTFEGARRTEEARADLAALRDAADCVLVFHNDRLADLPAARADIRQAFHALNQELSWTVQALAQVLTKKGLIQLGFADLRSLYGRFRGCEVLENSWVGYAEAHSGDDEIRLIRQLLDSPLLAIDDLWDQADHGILNLSGGSDLSLRDVHAIAEALQKQLPKNFPVAVNANLEEAQTGSVRLTLLLAATRDPAIEERSEIAPVAPQPVSIHDTQPIQVKVPPRVKLKTMTPEDELLPAEEMASVAPSDTRGKEKQRKHLAKQEELPFELAHRGRFENSMETIYKGENLDQPTFRRRRLQVRL